jgi:glucose/arabinose dehydrogenase
MQVHGSGSVALRLLILVSLAPALLAQNGSSPFYNFNAEKPGTVHRFTLADLPGPRATKSAVNPPDIAERPAGAIPKALPGFTVNLYADGFDVPREMRTAPNGDVFLAEMDKGEIKVLRGIGKDGKVEQVSTFASGLNKPFGIAFYPLGGNPQWVYIAETGAVKKFPYKNGDLKASGPAQTVVAEIFPGAGVGHGHTTRDVAFSPDGKKMYVSVGSQSNIDNPDDHPSEFHRANILEYNSDGSGMRVFASGIRNPVTLVFNPTTGQLWTSCNERDALGDNLVPDYTTHVEDGGFYGWPWYYMGKNHDPRLPDSHPDLKARVITPDVIIQPHSAPLGFTFYSGDQFPAEYKGDEFLALHGSWNREPRTGYELVRVPLHQTGKASGEYEDFLTGFVTEDGKVWGRPVGVTVAKDGSLLVSDDGSRIVWRVTYTGKK